jgi:proteasome accessory factor C
MSPRPLPGPRLRRVLALVPWIADHPGASLEELAARFGVSQAELERDLEYLPLCGLPPYTPDRLIDVEIVDGYVWIRFAEYFERPLRLSAEEGLGLLAAGRALLAVPGSDEHGALATALEKLAGALGAPEGVAVEVGEPASLDVLRRAAADHERVEIDYYSFGRDALTTRRIDLRSVFHAFGHWYAAAYCHQAEDERMFRVDRIRGVRTTGEHYEPAAGGATEWFGESVYQPRPDDPRVTLELDAEAGWVVESYPCERAEERRDGTWRVVLAISELAFLERLLLRLGPAARVTAPAALQSTAADAATRLLSRYRRPAPGMGG